jgi:hypothetical protein
LKALDSKSSVAEMSPWVRIPPLPPMNVSHLPSRINKGSAGDCAFGQSGHLSRKRCQLYPKLSHGQLGHVLGNRKSVTRTRRHGDYLLPCGDRDLREFLRNWKPANARQVPPLPASERDAICRGVWHPASREPANQEWGRGAPPDCRQEPSRQPARVQHGDGQGVFEGSRPAAL